MGVVVLFDDELFDSVNDSIRSEASKHQQNLERRQLAVSGWDFSLGFFEVIPFFPSGFVVFEVVNEVSVLVAQSDESLHIFPSLFGHPSVGFLSLNNLKRSVTFKEEVKF
jgi:hypothetical protein